MKTRQTKLARNFRIFAGRAQTADKAAFWTKAAEHAQAADIVPTQTQRETAGRDTHAFLKARLEASMRRREADADAEQRAGDALERLSIATGNSVLRRAFDPTAVTTAHKAEKADASAVKAEAAVIELDAATADNVGASALVRELRAALPHDAAALRTIRTSDDAATVTAAVVGKTISDGMDIAQAAALSILESAARLDTSAPAWLEAEYTTLEQNRRVSAQGKEAAPLVEVSKNTMQRAHTDAGRYVDSMRGVRVSREKAVLYEDYTTQNADGETVGGLDYMYMSAGRFAGLAGEDASGVVYVSGDTIRRALELVRALGLTDAQTEIALYRARGLSWADIGKRIGVTEDTAKKRGRRAAAHALELFKAQAVKAEAAADAAAQADASAVKAAALEAARRHAAALEAAAVKAEAEADASADAAAHSRGRRTAEAARQAAAQAQADAARIASADADAVKAEAADAAQARAEAAQARAEAAARIADAPAALERDRQTKAARAALGKAYTPAALEAARAARTEAEAARMTGDRETGRAAARDAIAAAVMSVQAARREIDAAAAAAVMIYADARAARRNLDARAARDCLPYERDVAAALERHAAALERHAAAILAAREAARRADAAAAGRQTRDARTCRPCRQRGRRPPP